MELVDNTVSGINKRMNIMWKLECGNDAITIQPIEQSLVELRSNLIHNIPKLDEHILTQMRSTITNITPEDLLNNPSSDLLLCSDLKRYKTLDSILSSTCDDQDEHQTRIWIHDAESVIKGLEERDENLTSTQVYKLFQNYQSVSLEFYKSVHNPVGMSQVVLCTLKLVQILDIIATKSHPLLLKYASGITQSAFDKLLLPFRDDMVLLEKLLSYFSNRDRDRDGKAVYPGLLTSTKVNKKDFQVKYASRNKAMKDLKKKIDDQADVAIKKKYSEVSSALAACKSLQNEMKGLKCECTYETKWNQRQGNYVKTKVSTCKKCDLEKNLDKERHSVKVYERPLPSDIDKQWAVVFELLIPDDLANLRDALAFLNYSLLGDVVDNPPTKVGWKTYGKTKQFDNKRKCEFYNLISSVLSVEMKNHINKDLLKTTKEKFIVNNGMNCVYAHGCVDIEESYKFKISNTCSPDREMYLHLQYALEGTNINQNEVIADAYNCHKDMSLAEFKSFGFLRDGHRIQLRNLYAYISDATLALEKEPVLQLIIQTLWEVGEKEYNARIRHFEFMKDDAFTKDFLKILNQVVDQNEDSYSNVILILSVIVVTTRIVELNARVVPEALDFLRKCRSVLDKWVVRIGQSSNEELYDAGEVSTSLQLKLLLVSIGSAFTFNVSPKIDQQLKEQDLNHWLRTITRLHQLVNQDKCLKNGSPFIQSLVNTAFNVALQMEPKILPNLPTLLKTFAATKWKKANQCGNEVWAKIGIQKPPIDIESDEDQDMDTNPSEDSELVSSCYGAIYKDRNDAGLRHLLTFDYLLGIFLVDGFPQGGLPTQIRDHPLYQTYFGDTNLRVQQDANGFQTVAPFQFYHYRFSIHSDVVKIVEVHDEVSFQLVDASLFEDKIAKSFIESYTHWLHLDNKQVLFRKKPVTSDDYNKPAEFALERSEDGKDWNFKNILSNKFLWSVKSRGFQSIKTGLNTLEDTGSTHVMQDMAKGVITARLPRYGLNFTLIRGALRSIEYPRFRISEEQKLDTLIGLQRFLLLENKSKQKVIVPHGNIQVSREGFNHQVTNIVISSLHNPPYFIYDVDPVLCRLKAQDSKEAWLYLAALHGATSSPLPDPFTKLTGTEMAVSILQSARVLSSTPYNGNCLRIFKTIKDFSPKRRYFGQSVNVKKRHGEDIGITIWPEGLNDLAAYDGYALIVKKLIDDSNSLVSLSGEERAGLEEENVSEKLSVRAYLRNVSFYNQCAGLNALYFPEGYQQNEEKVVESLKYRHSRDSFDRKKLEHLSQYLLETDNRRANGNLKSFLITKRPLGSGKAIKSLQSYALADLLIFDFQANWLELYNHAISPQNEGMHEREQERQAWKMFFTTMSYMGVDSVQLMNLQLILECAHEVKFPPAPEGRFLSPSTNAYSAKRLESNLQKVAKQPMFLDRARKEFPEKSGRNPLKTKNMFRRRRDDHIEKMLESLKLDDDSMNENLASEKVQLIDPSLYFTNVQQIVDIINMEIQLISESKRLLEFVEKVEKILHENLEKSSNQHAELEQRPVAWKHKPMTSITLDITAKPYQQFSINSEELFNNSSYPIPDWCSVAYNLGIIELTQLRTRFDNLLTFINNVLTEPEQDGIEKRILAASGLSIRMTPTVLLPSLKKVKDPSTFMTAVGALAVLLTYLQRENRIEMLENAVSGEHELAMEKSNSGYLNWAPKEYPEWILLQLELDMMIRPIQVEVAKQLMEMPNGKNGVMQLNMGEGKTSVIIPMLCASLANCDSLVRVTVLKSMFETNLKILSFAIGGLLNQRVCLFPCKRDMEVNKEVLETMNTGFKTCLESRGVILTLPEHRLSFRLKIYDEINKGNFKLGLQMMETEAWLRYYVRDLLDESDELLSVKYQLMYTVGTQIPIDSNDLRWKTCQRLFEHVQAIASQLNKNFGSSVFEFENKTQSEHPERFEHFRVLSDTYKSNFYDQLADKVLKKMKKRLSIEDANAVKTFVTYEIPPMQICQRVVEITKDSKDLLNEILLWAGYIGRGILHLALTKRWRVEYGVDPKGRRLMAVPFRAKDVAAEKTEFGHPDLAIAVTQLSYYYSGLSDHELSQTFECLGTKNSPGMIYSSWTRKLNKRRLPTYLSSYQGINLKDLSQRTHLFNLLRRHKSVIDFYLSEKVFPKELKQFPHKMSMSAWDLCYEKNRLPISGFSGTNDSSVLLPLSITQQDLEQLAQTNVQLEQTLLQPENCGHVGLRMGVTCEEILKKMTDEKLKVLIDAGALMLELDNEQVASLWLTVDTSLEATVYFNRKNDFVVKTRSAVRDKSVEDMRLEFSPYRNRLGACGVYLDDQHTRGTDLSLLTGSRACVTIGTRMKREKLMQACMRMRKLGNGHSVIFYVSQEVFYHITQKTGLQILLTRNIIEWVRANTDQFNEDGLVYWALAGKNYAQKLAAEEMFREQKSAEAAKIMGAQVVDKEVTELGQLYGVYPKSELLFQLIPKLFQAMKQKLVKDSHGNPLRQEVVELLDTICSSVVSRCKEFVPRKTHVCSALEEEQEKELEKEKELEVEEERQVERPPKAEPVIPSLNPNVWTVLKHGRIISAAENGIVRISDVFLNVSFSNEIQPDGWGKNVYATKDFATVIKTNDNLRTDLHLRPVEYVAVKVDPASNTIQILVLSPFECNELIPLFRENSSAFTLHQFSIRRSERQDVLIDNEALQVASRGIQVDETDPALACLHLAAGTLYFNSHEGAKAYARFLGLVPRSWNDAQQNAFEKGWITQTGFRLPERINHTASSSSDVDVVDDEDEEHTSLFQFDTVSLVKHILACRHPEQVNDVAHVHVIELVENLELPFSSKKSSKRN